MENEQILKAAIEKAEANGFKWDGRAPFSWDLFKHTLTIYNDDGDEESFICLYEMIYSHDFAKAFFGEKEELTKDGICLHCGEDAAIRNPSGYCDHLYYPEACEVCKNKAMDWKKHLQQMVLEENPIQYLAKYIE